LLSIPLGTEMVHFPRFTSPPYGFRWRYPGFTRMGFPIRTSPDQSLLSDSPGLIAAGHVLHRLPAPRHPLHALSNLTIKFSQDKKNAAKFDCQRTEDLSLNPRPGGLASSGVRRPRSGGAGRDRTGGLRLAKPALSQLSYSPVEESRRRTPGAPSAGRRMVGLSGFEPLTSRLSGGRSNQLSYRPTPSRSRAGSRGSLTSEHKKKRSDRNVSRSCQKIS
jgi:hypothetical protein